MCGTLCCYYSVVSSNLWRLSHNCTLAWCGKMYCMCDCPLHQQNDCGCSLKTYMYIHFPQGVELSEVVEGFKDKWGMIQSITLVRYGRLALADPVSTAEMAFRNSKASNAVVQKAVKSGNPVNIADHDVCRRLVINDWRKERASQQVTQLEQLLQKMPVGPQRTLQSITKSTSNVSGWLSVLHLSQRLLTSLPHSSATS